MIPYAEIPGWPISTVEGHAGRLSLGRLAGRNAAVLQGRVHFYEGYTAEQIAFPVRVMRRLGAGLLIVTNAAGAINAAYAPGDLMLIADHINLPGLAGASPLRGPNDDRLGTRFPDMRAAYDPALRKLAREAAAEKGIALREGIYACVAGPSFETPAELRFLRTAGADAVGMSTAAETVAARHAGLRVLGISLISNRAALDGSAPTGHAEVLAASRGAAPKLALLLTTLLERPLPV